MVTARLEDIAEAPNTVLFDGRDAVLDRELDEPGDVADMQFLHHAAAVGIHALR